MEKLKRNMRAKILGSRNPKELEKQYAEFCDTHDVINVAFFVEANVMYYSLYYVVENDGE